MKTMKIYEAAMCCSTGLCGVSVDPELLRVSTVLNTLKQSGVVVQRFNLSNAPAEFVKNKAVTEYLQKFGPEKLPVVVVDDAIVIAGRYRQCQVVEFVDIFVSEVQRSIHFIGEHTFRKSEAHIRRVCNAGTHHGAFQLALGYGKVEPCDILRVLWLQTKSQSYHEHTRFIEICWEVLSIIILLQLHAVVVDHTVGRDLSGTAVDE